jgi:two-component system OmpR family response regulator
VVDVIAVSWPSEPERRRRANDDGLPSMLLVEPGTEPPEDMGDLEDWIRVPYDPVEFLTRSGHLLRRWRRRNAFEPVLETESGILRVGSRWIDLTSSQVATMQLLLDAHGQIVSPEQIRAAAWPGEAPSPNAVKLHVLRLRDRLVPVGLELRTLRQRGFLLERHIES